MEREAQDRRHRWVSQSPRAAVVDLRMELLHPVQLARHISLQAQLCGIRGKLAGNHSAAVPPTRRREMSTAGQLNSTYSRRAMPSCLRRREERARVDVSWTS